MTSFHHGGEQSSRSRDCTSREMAVEGLCSAAGAHSSVGLGLFFKTSWEGVHQADVIKRREAVC